MVVIVNSTGLYYKQSSKVGQGTSTNDALVKVRSSIKEASSIVASYTQDSTTYTSGDTQLVLKIPSLDSFGNLISDAFDYFVYFLDQNKLRFKTFPDVAVSSRKPQDQILSTTVDSLKFQFFDSSNNEVTPSQAVKVRINLTLKQKAGAEYERIEATSEASLRND